MIQTFQKIINDSNSHPVVIDIATLAVEINEQLDSNEIDKDEARSLYASLELLNKVNLDNMLDEDRQNAYNVLQMLKQLIEILPTH